MLKSFVEFLLYFGDLFFSAVVAIAALMIVMEIRTMRRERKAQFTSKYLATFMKRSPFPYKNYDHDALIRMAKFTGNIPQSSDDPNRQIVVEHLNSLELISTQLNLKVLDEDICRKYARSMFIRAYLELRVYIFTARDATDNTMIYSEFERVVRRWENFDDFG